MTDRRWTILAVGATGSIGRLVVGEAIRQGHAVRALVRSTSKARQLRRESEIVVRPHLALKGKTPWERVHELIPPPKPVRDLS